VRFRALQVVVLLWILPSLAGCPGSRGTRTGGRSPRRAAPDAGPDLEPALPRPAPLRRIDLDLQPLASKPALSLLGRWTLSVRVAPDGETLLQLRGRGGILRTLARKRGARLPRKHFTTASFSPGSEYLAVVDEKRRITILSVPRGKVLARIRKASSPRWISSDTIAFRRGCSGMKLQIGSRPIPIGAVEAPCEHVIHTSANYETWIIADPGRYRRGVYQTFTRLRRVDLTTGRVAIVAWGTDEAHFLLPIVSPDGERICYARSNFDLYCLNQDGEELIWRNARRPIAFDESGMRLLLASGKPTSPSSKIAIVDFVRRTLTVVPRAGREWWRFLPGGLRIGGHGGSSGAMVYDLARGWSAPIGDAKSEWEGLWPVPGDPTRLVVGRERGGTRDVYLVVLPE